MRYWYEDEVEALEAGPLPPPGEAVLLYGGSSIRLWTGVAADFPNRRVINHGFGGATLAECVTCFDRLVRPVRPGALLLYAGDNDIGQGDSGDDVRERFGAFAALMATMPPIPWAVLTIKPSPSRRHLAYHIRRANRLVCEASASIPNLTCIDLHTAMLDERSRPPFKYFSDDWLHLNEAGYALWARVVAPWMNSLPVLAATDM